MPGLSVVGGQAPAALAGLPRPDAVFIGGGVTAGGVVAACWAALADGGRLVANAVTIEGERVLADWRGQARRYADPAQHRAGRGARRLHRLAARAAGDAMGRPQGRPEPGGLVTVHFVGAGPGAADLITVRAQRLLSGCAVCLYAGSLVPAEVLAHCPPDATLIDTAGLTLDEIVAAMAGAHAKGQDVVRLCSGDPAVFSAIAEQARRLDRAGIPYDITPGVPAFAAAAAALRRELTVPGVGQTVVLTRIAQRATPMPPGEDLPSLGAMRCDPRPAPGRPARRAGRRRPGAALRDRLPGGGRRLREPGGRGRRCAERSATSRRQVLAAGSQAHGGHHRRQGAGGRGLPR